MAKICSCGSLLPDGETWIKTIYQRSEKEMKGLLKELAMLFNLFQLFHPLLKLLSALY